MIRKLFKLDEPLGRGRFLAISFILCVLTVVVDAFSTYYFNKDSVWFFITMTALITPFAVRRLKDIDVSEHFAGLFLLPVLSVLFFIFVMNENRHIFEPFIFYYTTAFFIIIPAVLAVFLLFLAIRKGNKSEIGLEQSSRFIRKNTLIIFLLISGTLFIISGVYQLEIYLGKENAMHIVRAVDKYKIEKGSYPAKIKDLVPDYMNETPETGGFLFIPDSFDYDKDCKEQWYCISFFTLTGKIPKYCSQDRVWKE